MPKTFYGTRSANVCAYCWKHHLSLTPKQVKTRKCLAHNCDALQRHEHPYWVMRDQRKQYRVERRLRLEVKYKEATHYSRTQQDRGEHAVTSRI